MTVLAQTPEYLVEFESGMFSISRFSDGHAIGLVSKGIAGEFRSCVKSHGAERATATYLRIAEGIKAQWRPCYKPEPLRARYPVQQ